MKIQTPPGMRDFYPDDMRVQNWLFNAWRETSLAFGFEEYEGPIFEFLDLFTIKSGDEIVEQLFHFEDRGGRRFAIRPEMTPTLARLVAARANALPRPIKWFSIPRMCRAEKPQRGRLREFFQWNVDVLGADGLLADAEVIAVAADLFRRIGVSSDEVVIRYSSRRLAMSVLHSLGVSPGQMDRAFQLVDRLDKMDPAEFAKDWESVMGDAVSAQRLRAFIAESSLEQALAAAESADAEAGAALRAAFDEFAAMLRALGVADYCAFDLRVVRGLAYYTGTIFEAYPRKIAMRALLGGGRYDNLTELVGGPRVPGVGFGAGDAPLLEFLRELKRQPEFAQRLDAFVIDAGAALFATMLEIVTALRRAGLRVDFSYKRQGVGKQFKQAADRKARFAIVVGAEYSDRRILVVKDLASGRQREISAHEMLADPAAVFAFNAMPLQ